MTYYCSTCVANWFPYMCNSGACPACGGGTKRTLTEPASIDAVPRFNAARAATASRERHQRFEAFYEDREVKLNGLDALPVAEPHRATA